MAYSNLVSDLEQALATRSGEAGAMLHQMTELFLRHVGHYSVEQLDLYDDVLNELVAKVETAARVKLARRLALVGSAPTRIIHTLALDNDIEVAEPILSKSDAVTDETLVQCIENKGQRHLLAIATRKRISEDVTEHLIAKGDKIVLGAVACNSGARISDPSFGVLVRKGADDDWLLECIAGRRDLPQHHLRELLARASEVVRTKLALEHPELGEIIEGFFRPGHL